ncbi:MAG: spondin domain-containing protein, partial [Acidobacteriota bacterium]
MLVTTNDAFFAGTVPELQRAVLVGSRSPLMASAEAPAYDAGSERNTENCDHIPGPPCMSPFQRVTDGAEGYVYVHAGVHGSGDLDAAMRDWRNPVARISVRRIH